MIELVFKMLSCIKQKDLKANALLGLLKIDLMPL